MSIWERQTKYAKEHINLVCAVHLLIGFGIALILSTAFWRNYPLFCYILGGVLIGVGVIGHLIPFFVKK